MMIFETGEYKEYYWIETHLISISDLIKHQPDLFLGKFLIISHFDGGIFKPNDKETKRNWKLIDGLTYTEFISKDTFDYAICDNYDQWILMNQPTKIDKVDNFVNYGYFSLIDWTIKINDLTSEDDINFINDYSESRLQLLTRFWNQIEIIAPTNFISDGSKMIFVSKIKNEIDLVKSTIANNAYSK